MPSFFPFVPTLEVFLISEEKELYKVERFKSMLLPPIDGAIAKTCHMQNADTGEQIIVVLYPDLLTDEPIEVTCTLVHEAVHAWDYTREVFGYDKDLELNAYMIENTFKGLYEIYAKKIAKKEKKDAKRA